LRIDLTNNPIMTGENRSGSLA